MGPDGVDGGLFVVGGVHTEAVEEVQGALPMSAGKLGLVQRVVGVGDPVMGARLIGGLVKLNGERERLVVVAESGFRATGGVV